MEKDTKAIDGQPVAAATVVVPATPTEEDIESRLAALEAEKAKAIEEAANYKLAFLKEKNKSAPEEHFEGESEDDRIRRITREELSHNKIAAIDLERESLLKQALKENKELKLAHLNKTPLPNSDTSHSEGPKVLDTIVTPEQVAAFKARGWDDQKIERYKQNYRKQSGR